LGQIMLKPRDEIVMQFRQKRIMIS
jgi:hypothetical protein